MDFYRHQDNAKRGTAVLIVLYTLAVVAIVTCVHALLAFLFQTFTETPVAEDSVERVMQFSVGVLPTHMPDATYWNYFLNPRLALFTAGIPAAILLLGSALKILTLGNTGARVAESVGGRRVDDKTNDPDERRLLNIVDEMAIASGIPAPAVYVLDSERGINAFVAGYSSNAAAVAVTRGALESFNRDELQAVIGHEFSHILNGDMRLNIRLLGVLGGILGISVAGRVLIQIGRAKFLADRHPDPAGMSEVQKRVERKHADVPGRDPFDERNKRNDEGAISLPLLVAGGTICAVGSIGAFFARLIQCAISRRRETLADASAVQFTRNPDALANALKIIAVSRRGGSVSNAHASEVAHMLFTNSGSDLLATHPPLNVRIKRLDPHFDGNLAAARAELKRRLAGQRTQSATRR